ncbi:hypothetical protein FRC98_02585 [Lujinxingia vulgaris]|uniref:Uncharacterized protein n=1 Tax=Lujinxingia vulgaris TaxID=2600176 RepID=A0A5C6XHF3_9DELT|nr:hypothetical protein [Lujinxingia vulgaris]TXD39304.1 hypothetical protein FRC98_02585 [Lujinxingia vulgaris]
MFLCLAWTLAACGDDASVVPNVPAPTCDDGAQNGVETDVDCGGDTCGTCDVAQSCDEDSDCASEVCDEGVCVSPALPDPTCDDGAQNGDETDVDCGGECGVCDEGLSCDIAEDCSSGVCDEGICAIPACNDGVQNGDETDVDCGGACGACDDGLACNIANDCASGVCNGGFCAIPACDDGVENGDETDVDCGGACGACDDGLACAIANDCASGVCDGGFCAAPSCDDGVQNGSETDQDCGGDSCSACDTAGACLLANDCLSRLCLDGFCAAPNTPHYGDGSEGDVSVLTGEPLLIDADKTSLISHTADTLTVSDASFFEAGDEVLVITMKSLIGAAGTHEFAFVESVTDDTLSLSTALTHVYDAADTTMVQRVPHFSDLIVDGTLTASAWNGTLGGVVAFRVSGTLTVNESGQILADGLGFVGGIRGERSGTTRTGGQGETFLKTTRLRARGNNEGGGGGGTYGGSGSEDDAGGGGGGSHATAGANGVGKHGSGGIAGTTYGAGDATLLTAGSGGGGGGADHYTGGAGNSDGARGGAGGAGGGIIFIAAAQVQLNGAVRAAGLNGNNAVREDNGEGGGGGGGAGGLVLIYTETAEADRGSVLPSAAGGIGGVGSLNNGPWNTTRGGDGGEGYVHVLAP